MIRTESTSYKSKRKIQKTRKWVCWKIAFQQNEVINSINLSQFNMSQCAIRNGLPSNFLIVNTPGRSNFNFSEHCRCVDQWSPFELHSNANWRSVSAALISNHNDWQCFFVVRFDLDFRCTVTKSMWFFFWRRGTYLSERCGLKCASVCACAHLEIDIFFFTVRHICSHAEKTPLMCASSFVTMFS